MEKIQIFIINFLHFTFYIGCSYINKKKFLRKFIEINKLFIITHQPGFNPLWDQCHMMIIKTQFKWLFQIVCWMLMLLVRDLGMYNFKEIPKSKDHLQSINILKFLQIFMKFRIIFVLFEIILRLFYILQVFAIILGRHFIFPKKLKFSKILQNLMAAFPFKLLDTICQNIPYIRILSIMHKKQNVF